MEDLQALSERVQKAVEDLYYRPYAAPVTRLSFRRTTSDSARGRARYPRVNGSSTFSPGYCRRHVSKSRAPSRRRPGRIPCNAFWRGGRLRSPCDRTFRPGSSLCRSFDSALARRCAAQSTIARGRHRRSQLRPASADLELPKLAHYLQQERRQRSAMAQAIFINEDFILGQALIAGVFNPSGSCASNRRSGRRECLPRVSQAR